MTQQHGLTWGALDFVDPNPTADGYVIEACADGTNFGNPRALIQTVRSLLTDGSLAVVEGWDNREIPIHLRISAPDAIAGPALAAAEAALMAELHATTKAPLIYTPVTTDAPASYYDVVVAELQRTYDNDWDFEETQREERYYLLTLTCLPFARPEETSVAVALGPAPSVPTVVDIDDCTSATAWAYGAVATNVTGLTTLVSSGGSINTSGTVVGDTAGTPEAVYSEVRTGSITMGATPFLRITATVSGAAGARIEVFYGGAPKAPVATGASSLVVGATDYYFTPGASLSNLTIYVYAGGAALAGSSFGAQVYHVARTDALPGSGSTRQQARLATVRGSAPTQAAIRLFDATPAALGTEIMVHTSRNTAWKPSLRAYRTSSATVTVDSAMVSGSRNTLASSMVFRIPANLLTEGTYALLARMSISTGGTFGWSAKMVSSAGTTTVGSSVVTSGSVTVGVTSGYQVLNLAALPLPVVKVEADQMVELTLTGTSNMTVDEVWLFGLHDGVLTWLRDADSLTWIEIRSPELGAARPSIYGGTGAKGANSIDVSWKAAGSTYGSFGAHRFEPGLMQIFTVTSTSLVSQSEIEFYPRYHSHVTDEAA